MPVTSEAAAAWLRRIPGEGGQRLARGWLVGGPIALAALHAATGLRLEHVGIVVAMMGLAWVGPRVRSFVRVATPLVLTGIGYELLRWVMPLRGEIHVGDLWTAEVVLFGVPTAGGVRAASELVARATHPLVDAWAGVTYFLYLIQVVALVTFLLFRDRERAWRLACAFLTINLLGWFVWLAWPAAPPWYVDQYGLGPVRLDAASSAAGALRFDALVGIPLFERFYAKSTDVFGAMPSLHVGYAVLSALAAWRAGRALRVATLAFALSMGFSAVYLRHHYILDVLAGAGLAVLAHGLTRLAIGMYAREAAPSVAGGPAP